MDISEIGHKANSRPVTNRLYQLDAEEFNAMLDELINLRTLVGNSGVVYSVRMQNDLDSRNIAASIGSKCELKFTFVSRMRDGLADWESTGESATLKVSLKNISHSDFTVMQTIKVADGQAMTLDVSEWLASGANQIMLEATGEISKKTTSALVYTVQLTSLAISAEGFQWWRAFANNIEVPYRISGNINKTLVVTISGSGYSKTYEQNLGDAVFTESPYPFTVPHPARTGVFKISAYLRNSDGTIRTSPSEYNVICYLKGSTAKLMAVNNVAEAATNWNETAVFDFCIYEGDAATSSTTFKVTKDKLTVFQREDSNLATNTKHTLILPLEIETVDDLDFNITINAYNGEYTMTNPVTMKVNNSTGYSPSAGASVYINPKTRSNAAANRLKLINEVTGEEITPIWKNTNWYNDGHTVDENGNSVMRLIAGSSCDTGITPLKPESARTGKLFEMEYRISNTTDFNVPVIQCAKETAGGWVGIKVYPDRVVTHTAALKIDDDQSFKFNTEDRIHLAMAVMPDIYGTKDYNVCILYVNGVKNREFSYESNDYFLVDDTLKIGSDYADVDIYGIRVYNLAVGSDGIVKNFMSWRSSNDEKAAIKSRNDLYDAAGTKIDIEKVKKLCNVVVFEGEIPSYTNPNKFRNNGYVYWRDHPSWNIKLTNVPQDGQGTSSKFYYLWNQRWKTDDNTTITYADGTTATKKFTFIPGMPKISKFTWKLNWASSCQCNKMGSVNSINDLATLLDVLDEIKSRPSIYQEPFVGFQLTYNEEGKPVYTLLGLYTGGPDKSDSGTMGMDTDTYPDLLFVEGADNGSKCALFKVPWNKNKSYIKYNADEESLQYNGENAWDYDGGAPETQAAVQALYEKCWMPRYNFVYQCSPNLTYWSGTVDSLNSAANIAAHRDDDTEFWVDGGNVYYYEAAEGKFIPSDIGNGTINLFTQLVDKGYGLTSSMTSGKTGAQLNELFVAARILKFDKEAPSYFGKRNLIFTRNWIEFKAGSDNRTKNTYFFMLGAPSSGYLCYCKHDDTDTIGPWTNQGQDKKGYWVEVGDKYDNGNPVWNGEQNRLFNLVELAWQTDIKEEMAKYMNGMIELSGSNTGTNADKLYAFFHKYYFSKAQEYFPQTLYNSTAQILYESAKLALKQGRYENDTDPLSQSMGDYYSGWKRWVTYRIQYMQSKYAFGDYSAKGTGHIIVRAAGNDITYELTPAIWMYPCVATGTSIIRGVRTAAGQTSTVTISLAGSADQQNQIKGAHYLQSIGYWHNKHVTGQLTIVGRMLRELHIGHPTEDITISITTLSISETPSLQLVDVRRVSTLGGVLDLTSCTHLQKVYASGSSVAQVKLPSGGPLNHVEYAAANQYLILRNFPLLASSGVVIDTCLMSLTDVLVENCAQLNSIDILRTIMSAQQAQGDAHALQHVRAVGFDAYYEGVDGTEVMDLLAQLADGSYSGLDSNGLAGSEPVPVLDGTLTINSSIYKDSEDALKAYFNRLVLNITGEYYIRFADKVVQQLCATNWGDGVGLTESKAATVTSLGSVFGSNTEITSFNELELFTGLKTINSTAFKNCSNLKSVKLSNNVTTIDGSAFAYSGIETIQLPESIKVLKNQVFEYCTNLIIDTLHLPNLTSDCGAGTFRSGAQIRKVTNLGNITTLQEWFSSNKLLESCVIPETVKTIAGAFSECSNLTNVNLPKGITTANGAFNKCTNLKIEIDLPNLTGTLGSSFANSSGITKVISLGNITTIADNCFYNCQNLVSMVLPNTLEAAGYRSIHSCPNLVFDFANLPKSLKRLSYFFADCKKAFGEVSLPNVESTDSSAFSGTLVTKVLDLGKITVVGSFFCDQLHSSEKTLTEVHLPATVTAINDAFCRAATSLKIVVVNSVTPPTLNSSAFSSITVGAFNIYVPDSSVSAYQTATNWSKYANYIKPLSELPE